MFHLFKIFASIVLGVGVSSSGFAFQSQRDQQEPSCNKGQSCNPTYAEVELVLEGPMVVCMKPEGFPNQIMILIPKVKGHFEPGFDAGGNETILCREDYELTLGGHTQVPPTSLKGQGFNVVPVACPANPNKYLSLLLDAPDKIQPLTGTQSTITGEYGSEGVFANRTVLTYLHVDINQDATPGCQCTFVDRRQKGSCKTKVSNGWFSSIDLTVPIPYYPQFSNAGTEKELIFSLTPKQKDDASHHHARDAYKATARLLGLDSTVEFPPLPENDGQKNPQIAINMILSPHNDCRAPQMFAQPDMAAKQKQK